MCVPVVHVDGGVVFHEVLEASLLRGVNKAQLLKDGNECSEFVLQHIHDKMRVSPVIVEVALHKTVIAVDAPPVVYMVVVQSLLELRDEMPLDELVEFGIESDILTNLVCVEQGEGDEVATAVVDWLVDCEVC